MAKVSNHMITGPELGADTGFGTERLHPGVASASVLICFSIRIHVLICFSTDKPARLRFSIFVKINPKIQILRQQCCLLLSIRVLTKDDKVALPMRCDGRFSPGCKGGAVFTFQAYGIDGNAKVNSVRNFVSYTSRKGISLGTMWELFPLGRPGISCDIALDFSMAWSNGKISLCTPLSVGCLTSLSKYFFCWLQFHLTGTLNLANWFSKTEGGACISPMLTTSSPKFRLNRQCSDSSNLYFLSRCTTPTRFLVTATVTQVQIKLHLERRSRM